MITMYDTPKKVKLVDLFPNSNQKYYIQRFEYGDYDNWVTALVYETHIVFNDFSFNSKFAKNGVYKTHLATTFIPIDEVEKMNGNFINSQRKFVGCGNDLKISCFEDITEATVKVDGEWTRD